MIQPNFAQFEHQYRAGKIVPLFMKIPGDLDTPLSAFLKIDNSVNSFLLESVEGGERWGRFSFLGSDPRMVIAFKEGGATILEGDSVKTIPDVPDPTRLLKEIMARFRRGICTGTSGFLRRRSGVSRIRCCSSL